MNRGNIPGFYFDEEKKKYFKIQKDHLVPTGTKYSYSNAKEEKQETKRRKKHHVHQKQLAKQTVNRTKTARLESRFGTGIIRELGIQKPARDQRARDVFVLKSMGPDLLRFKIENQGDPIILDSILLEDCEYKLTAISRPGLVRKGQKSALYRTPWNWDRERTESGLLPREPWTLMGDPINSSLCSFKGDIVSVSLGRYSPEDNSQKFVACARETHSGANIYIGTLTDHYNAIDEASDEQYGRPTPFATPGYCALRQGENNGDEGVTIWGSAFSPSKNDIAIGGNKQIMVLDEAAEDKPRCITPKGHCHNIDWLNDRTVMFSQTGERREKKGVVLWDIRVTDTSLRFPIKNNITGLNRPTEDERQIVVSDNYAISVFDTRMNKDPVHSIQHVHEGVKLRFTTDMPGVIAAIDKRNDVFAYSLRTGELIHRFPRKSDYHDPSNRLTSLRYFDGKTGGPMFQACRGSTVVKWIARPED